MYLHSQLLFLEKSLTLWRCFEWGCQVARLPLGGNWSHWLHLLLKPLYLIIVRPLTTVWNMEEAKESSSLEKALNSSWNQVSVGDSKGCASEHNSSTTQSEWGGTYDPFLCVGFPSSSTNPPELFWSRPCAALTPAQHSPLLDAGKLWAPWHVAGHLPGVIAYLTVGSGDLFRHVSWKRGALFTASRTRWAIICVAAVRLLVRH